ncbi:dystrobrevin beta-like [Paramacrobiotus metropolitanus]|uniref:dystrobrevin beta-like n=1 Tax=Paramacrobiotus metropolitanus TaxID=2943436 RepID=UPI0024457F4A|nr:dystrobrevin beta-like [Paramacrobiotus metropolitanus]
MDDRAGMNALHNVHMQSDGGALPNPKPILDDFNAQDFNSIRFAAYRMACKLHHIQTKASLHQLDVVNVMEMCLQSGLDSNDLHAELGVGRLREVCARMYRQLNQRLPSTASVDVNTSTEWLVYWLLTAYDTAGGGMVRIFAFKIALILLCRGSLVDKLTYIFGLISTTDGIAHANLLDAFLLDLLQLPRACGEGPSFSYSQTTYADCFGNAQQLSLDAFLECLVGVEPGPPPVVWLTLMHNINDAQEIHHNVHCNSCHRNGFNGFRYKCQQCPNYQTCQECFWKGRVNGRHTLEHEMKETSSTYKSPAKQFGDSLRRSFRRSKSSRQTPNNHNRQSYSATASPEPAKPIHPQSTSSLPMYNGNFPTGRSPSDFTGHSGYGTLNRQHRRPSGFDTSVSQDDEHILIARYAAMLQNQQSGKSLMPTAAARLHQQIPLIDHHHVEPTAHIIQHHVLPQNQPVVMQMQPEVMLQPHMHNAESKEQIIADLEAKNREIMREIAKMRRDQITNSQLLHSTTSLSSANLLSELKALRIRKYELEQHMNTLQDSRKQLMDQLEIWMKRLKMSQSSRSTPVGSPRPLTHSLSNRKYSTLPRMGNRPSPTPLADRSYGGSQNWQQDLLHAADSVTNAMTSLVRELNSEDDREFATAMSLHGNGGTGRKTVKLYTVPTIYPSDDEHTNGIYNAAGNLDNSATANSLH